MPFFVDILHHRNGGGASLDADRVQEDTGVTFEQKPVLRAPALAGNVAVISHTDVWGTGAGIVTAVATFPKLGALRPTGRPGEYAAVAFDWKSASWSFGCTGGLPGSDND